MFVFFFILMFALLLVLLFYFVTRVKKFYVIQKLSGGRKWLELLLSTVPLLIIIPCGFFAFMNTLIVVIHLLAFCLIFDILGFLVKKFLHKQSKYYWQGISALVVSIVYLGFGFYSAHHVWETTYQIQTTKDLGMDSLRIVQISDSHIGTTFDGDVFARHMETIQKTNPDILVITGDYVDDDTTKEEMKKSCAALGKFRTRYGIYFVYGNHDKGYFKYRDFSETELVSELERNHVIILEDEAVLVDNKFYVIGRQDRSVPDRLALDKIVNQLDSSKYMIVLDHQPNDYTAESKTEADLVLSGHTHGGQLIPIGSISLITHTNDQVHGLKTENNTSFIVNSGISDWAIDFKTGCFSEYGVIDVISMAS